MGVNNLEYRQKKRLNLLSMLQKGASEKKRSWWNNYLKGVIEFRGIGIPAIREILKRWYEVESIIELPFSDQHLISLELLGEKMAEDKLSGILMMQIFLVDQIPWEKHLSQLELIYKKGSIFDWNTCDWLCVRVIGPLIKRNEAKCAEKVLSWHKAENLWQARSALVSFVNLVQTDQYHSSVFSACQSLLRREERFSKTAVGWVLREISKSSPESVLGFMEEELEGFSLESLKNALKYHPEDIRQSIIADFKSSH